jgi:hypothetical protein
VPESAGISVVGASKDALTNASSEDSTSSVVGDSTNEVIGCSEVSASSDTGESVDSSEDDSAAGSLALCVSPDSPGSTTESITDLGFFTSRFNRTRGETPIKA